MLYEPRGGYNHLHSIFNPRALRYLRGRPPTNYYIWFNKVVVVVVVVRLTCSRWTPFALRFSTTAGNRGNGSSMTMEE